jgi:hypothetical protein
MIVVDQATTSRRKAQLVALFTHAKGRENRGQGKPNENVGQKKTAVLLAPPKFREETSKKAVRLSATAMATMPFADAARKGYLLRCSIILFRLALCC